MTSFGQSVLGATATAAAASGSMMPDLSTLASPFENFLHYVPKEHETVLRQALYNSIVASVFLGLGVGAYYVLVVLEPFLVPLFWAILTGFVLHPYKNALSQALTLKLEEFNQDQTTTAWLLCKVSLSFANSLCEGVGLYIFSKIKIILAALLVFCVGYFLYHSPPALLYFLGRMLLGLWNLPLTSGSNLVQWPHVLVPALALAFSLAFLKREDNEHLFKMASLVVWTLAGLFCIGFLWTPLFYLVLGLIIVALVWKFQDDSAASDEQNNASDDPDGANIPFLRQMVHNLLESFHFPQSEEVSESTEEEEKNDGAGDTIAEEGPQDEPDRDGQSRLRSEVVKKGDATTSSTPARAGAGVKLSEPPLASTPARPAGAGAVPRHLMETPSMDVIQHPGVSALKKQTAAASKPLAQKSFGGVGGVGGASSIGPTPQRSHLSMAFSRRMRHRHQLRTTFRRKSVEVETHESATYIRFVLWSCGLIQFYLHPGLLHLLPIPMTFYLVKHLLAYFNLTKVAKQWFARHQATFHAWFESHEDILLPPAVRQVSSSFFRLERRVMEAVPNYVDPIVTVILIVTMIVSVVVFGVFVSFQLYAESVHMVQSSGVLFTKLSNSSVFQQLNDSIWDPEYQSGLESMLESAYHSGRDHISSAVRNMVGEKEVEGSAQELETKVLELWDRMYQYWLSRREKSLPNDGPEHGPQVSEEAISNSASEILNKVLETEFLNLSSIAHFVQDNMGTLTSILEHAWVLVKGNIGLVMTLVLELLKVLLLSGSGVVNFLLSIVVYFTALFYLLSNSGPIYKPVELMYNYGHIFGEGFGDALNTAVNGIFSLTCKMACFYGLWTYLTHTVFNVSIVMVPVLVATFLAAVPVAGQYLVPVPAALELWLGDDRWLAALCLVLCHVAPMWVVDAAIYAEVRRGMHPWLTGLSIVGGVYCFGVPGAIYGPLILCAVFVVLSMYTSVLQDIPAEEEEEGLRQQQQQQQQRSRFQTPLLRRSESIF